MSKLSRRPNRAHRHDVPPVGAAPRQLSRKTKIVLGLVAAAGVVGLFAATTLLGSNDTTNTSPDNVPLAVGDTAPAFEGADVTTGRKLSSTSTLAGKNVLYYFSEGVMCQACLVQIQALEKHLRHLDERGITLVSITNDDAATLQTVAADYQLSTPLVSDASRELTLRFGALGGGMHPDTANHTFILVDKAGTVRYVRDYPSMWVEPTDLLKALPKVSPA